MAMQETTPPRTHEQDLAVRKQMHDQAQAFRLQLARVWIIFAIVAIWLGQTAFVTYYAVDDPAILDDVEKFIALIAVSGSVATVIIMKLWPDQAPPS